MEITVNYLPEETIFQAAEDELSTLGLSATLPVPIEMVLERKGVHIISVPGLRRVAGVDAFSSMDLTEIRVDEGVYKDYEYRYLFSLAHEYGHMVLHRPIFTEVEIGSMEDWKTFINEGMSKDNYGKLEYQANAFAGYFLVPRAKLKERCEACLPQVQKAVSQAERNGLKRSQYLDSAISFLARSIQQTFNVSEEVLVRRIEKDGLDALIP